MYTEHFGLDKGVFDGGIAQSDDLFLGARQQRVAANLKIGLTTRDAVVLLTGPLGVGKTTIASEALRITTTRRAQTWVGSSPLAPDEMLELLLAGFELAPFDMGRVQRIHTWRQFMGEMSVTDTPICVLVENALALGVEGLQALEALTAADPNDCPGANLVLMGPSDLNELLERPQLAALKQRVRSRQRLEPMTPEEVEQYLRHRLAAAGGDYDTICAPGTAAMVQCFSAGIPRVINNVCETALTVAATGTLTQLNPETVQRVAESVYGLAPNGEIPEVPVAPTPEPAAASDAAEQAPAEEPAPADEVPAPDIAPVAAEEPPAAEPAVPAEPEQPAAEPITAAESPAQEPAPVGEPVAAVEQPTPEPPPPVEPTPVESTEAPAAAIEQPTPAPEPAITPAAAVEQPMQEPAPVTAPALDMERPSAGLPPAAEPAPIDTVEPPAESQEGRLDFESLVAPTELPSDPEEAPAVHASTEAQDAPVEHAPEPPVLTEAFLEGALADLQNGPLPSSTTESVERASEPPVLTEKVDIEPPIEIEDVAADAQSPAAMLPPDAPELPESELRPDEDFSEDFAAATHLHEISDEMAEMLFSADPASSADPETSATGVFEAAIPLESDEIGEAIERTAVVGRLNEEDVAESDDDPPAASTVVF